MHRHTLHIFRILISLVALASCGGTTTPSGNAPAGTDTLATQTAQGTRDTLRSVSYPVSTPFDKISSLSCADIIFTEGEPSITCESRSDLASHLQTEIDGGMLTVNIMSEKNPQLNQYVGKLDVTLRISCPQLTMVALCGSGNFIHRGTLHSTSLHLGSLGTGSFDIDAIDAGSVRIEHTGPSSANNRFGHIKATTVEVFNLGHSTCTAAVDCKELYAENEGDGHMQLTGKAATKEFGGRFKNSIVFK